MKILQCANLVNLLPATTETLFAHDTPNAATRHLTVAVTMDLYFHGIYPPATTYHLLRDATIRSIYEFHFHHQMDIPTFDSIAAATQQAAYNLSSLLSSADSFFPRQQPQEEPFLPFEAALNSNKKVPPTETEENRQYFSMLKRIRDIYRRLSQLSDNCSEDLLRSIRRTKEILAHCDVKFTRTEARDHSSRERTRTPERSRSTDHQSPSRSPANPRSRDHSHSPSAFPQHGQRPTDYSERQRTFQQSSNHRNDRGRSSFQRNEHRSRSQSRSASPARQSSRSHSPSPNRSRGNYTTSPARARDRGRDTNHTSPHRSSSQRRDSPQRSRSPSPRPRGRTSPNRDRDRSHHNPQRPSTNPGTKSRSEYAPTAARQSTPTRGITRTATKPSRAPAPSRSINAVAANHSETTRPSAIYYSPADFSDRQYEHDHNRDHDEDTSASHSSAVSERTSSTDSDDRRFLHLVAQIRNQDARACVKAFLQWANTVTYSFRTTDHHSAAQSTIYHRHPHPPNSPHSANQQLCRPTNYHPQSRHPNIGPAHAY